MVAVFSRAGAEVCFDGLGFWGACLGMYLGVSALTLRGMP